VVGSGAGERGSDMVQCDAKVKPWRLG
jgi:hypothetical protein